MQKHWFFRLLSTVLVLVMLFQMLPAQILAVENENPVSSGSAPTISDPSEEPKPATVIGEAESLRTETGKHFRLSDGSFLAVNYGTAVHYQDNSGDWQEIDNRPVLANNQAVYVAQNGDATTAYAAALTTGDVLSASYGDASVTMRLLDTAQAATLIGLPGQINADAQAQLVTNGLTFNRTATANIVQDADAQVSTYARSEKDENQGWTAEDLYPAGMNATVLYEDVFPGVDLQYTAYSHNIKEQIIINQVQSAYRYDFFLALDGLVAALNADGSVTLVDEAGDPVYSIPAPYMEDSAGVSSDAVAYTLTPVTGGAVLTVTADKAWIESEDRVFPVYVDPTLKLTTGNGIDEILCVFSMEAASTTNTFGRQYQYVGNMPVGNNRGRYRMFINFEKLPEIPDGAVLTEAKLRLYSNQFSKSGFTQIPLAAYDMITTLADSGYSSFFDWFARITWKKQPTYDTSNAIDYVLGSSTKGERYFDLTELAKKWYTGEDEATIAIVAANEDKLTTSKYAAVRFYGYGVTSPPLFTVAYRNNVGIESYYSYATLGAGSAGTAYIADATGQLKVAKALVSYASTVNSFTMNLIYNSDYFNFDGNSDGYLPAEALDTNMNMGNGWKLDIIQRMEEETISGIKYLKYTDGDGTIHYFTRVDTTNDPYKDYDPNLYYDEDGLGLKIQETSANNYIMSDDNDNTWIFTDNLLTETADANGNKILINYIDGRITSVQQQNKDKTAIDVATFAYSGNVLQSVTDAADNVYTLVYTDGELTSIQMNGETVAEYTYDSHRITALKDTDSGYQLNAYYDGGKVSRYNESVTTENGTEYGVEVSVDYENAGKTTYRDYGNDRIANTADDILTSYLFDYTGRTANVYTTDSENNILGASNAVYSANDGADKRNNRTLRSASIGVAAQQLILNSGFEDSETNTWTLGSGASLDTSVKRTGSKALKMTGGTTASKTTLPLTTGKTYTLSGYINTSAESFNATAGGVQLQISGGGEPFTSEAINYATSSAVDGGWVRVSVTFTAQQSAAYTVTVCGTDVSGEYYVDDLQLEIGEAPSNRNLLENGNMETANYSWSHTETDTVDNTTAVSFVSQDERNVLRILGNPDSETTASTQTVMLNLPSSQTYVLSGWAKADAVPDNMSSNEDPAQDLYKQCGLRAILYYADDNNAETEETEYYYAAFNSDLTDWQFTSLTIVPKQAERTVEKIDVVCAYERNANIAYFDNLSLVREVAKTMTYDQDGNLVSVLATGLKEEVDTYENGNLIRSVTGGNGTYTYEYDETNKQRLTAVKHNNITQSMDYDAVGNVTSTTLTNSVDNFKMVTGASYTNNQNLAASVTDASMQTEYFSYDSPISLMYGHATSSTDAMGTVTSSTYNNWGHITKKEIANTVSLEYNYDNGDITEVKRTDSENITQSLLYQHDLFGQLTNVCIGNISLTSFVYGPQNGNLISQTYGSGENASAVTFSYDHLQRTTQASYSSGRVLQYFYAGDGELYKTTDNNATDTLDDDITYFYTYDSLDRLIICRVQRGAQTLLHIEWEYDDCNRIKAQSWQMGDASYSECYAYSATDGNLTSITLNDSEHAVIFTYDNLQRLTTVNTGLYTKEYKYHNLNDTQTTSQVTLLEYSGNVSKQFGYSYNALGNIATYQSTTETPTAYEYDKLGQLISALSTNRTGYQYTYDTVGNIQSVTHGATHNTYTYGNTQWRDLLTKFNGMSIAYEGQTYNADENTVSGVPTSGNPISYYNGTRWWFSWAEGNKLVSALNNNNTIAYTYDANGQRTSKTVNGVQHDYVYAGGKLLREIITNDASVITLDFRYDDCGYPFALTYTEGTSAPVTYYYITNLQGDVISLVDANGTEVAAYTYDPYGKVSSETGSMALVNPLRYRGYYYDSETAFYYLISRYYDPAICRFISADSLVSTGQSFLGYNAFAYCGNNPVNRSDDGGGFWDTVFDVISIGFSVADVIANPTDPWAWAGLVGDVVDLVPFVSGVGEVVRAVSTVADVVDVVDDVYDTAKFIDRADDVIDAADNLADSRKVIDNLDFECPAGSGHCFVAGTQIAAENGAKNIEEIKPGDFVWAWDETTGNVALKQVVETYVNQSDELIHVFVNGEEIITTPSHPFYSPVKGWTNAVHLRAGDILVLVNGEYDVVEKIQHEILEAPVTVYNFNVEDYHTYYVSNTAVLVHNSCNHNSSWAKERKNHWISEGNKYTDADIMGQPSASGTYVVNQDNVDLMRKGYAPIGTDGNKVHLHHPEGIANNFNNYVEITATDHRLNFRTLHAYLYDK